MSNNRYILFETYRLGILIGHLQPEELIERLDDFIATTPIEDIPHVFYVLSLASDRRQMLQLLTDLTRGFVEELPGCIVAGLLYKDRARYTTEELFEKSGLLAALIKDPEDDIAIELTELKEAYDKVQQAYGLRFKRKKPLERMLARNEKQLLETLGAYEKYTVIFIEQSWVVKT